MTDPHPTSLCVTDEQWQEQIAEKALDLRMLDLLDKVMELSDTLSLTREALAALERRVGALEGEAPLPAESLVEVVARAIDAHYCDDMNSTVPEARAAIAAVAGVLRTQGETYTGYLYAAQYLEAQL